ncbi:precorrin-2 C(20)-methyltransferase [Desulforhopalus singaporensis]|uniref:Precorrin-2 C20-methyltransferase /cobalt-factor II C20-methyltransferase n=1 Tax=Desulforhopalus singaporensis TaxID=91360 RepID=A0A1H0NY67_9BACT|nr:precorrin-2 C(20)-methyltransferase [Desulforhopalus singaporensis]SDO97375.1 precorrin-2 C20-methyltransferase /cobalt-factor II C20-methyltransferase [Desulforhopalus singaporensis]
MMEGTFYVVGVGPGDPQLVTLKAAAILERCNTWFVPSAFENGGSMALKIASGAVKENGKTILSHRFPMKQVHRGADVDPEVKKAWRKAAETIIEYLKKGEDVVFPTLGDPAIYSTGFYLCETLQEYGSPFRVEIVPGVSAIGASSAVAGQPLCLGDERLVVIPATFENDRIKEILELTDVVVFMKVYKVMDRLVSLLEELDLVENAVLIEKCSLEDQRVWTDIRKAQGKDIHYFSTMVVRKK